MGRTVPSFRIVVAEEKADWKPFRNALDIKERKEFDEMWDIPKLYAMACSGSCQLVPLHPIILSILFHHYLDLLDCMEDVKRMKDDDDDAAGIVVLDNRSEQLLSKEEEAREKEEYIQPKMITMDSYFVYNNSNNSKIEGE
jgi:hypothetical protein